METLLALVHERNLRETLPFVDIHADNDRLRHQVEVLQTKCDDLQRQLVLAKESEEHGNSGEENALQSSHQHRSESAALRNERKLKEQVERMEEQIQQQQDQKEEMETKMRQITKERDDSVSLQAAQEKTMTKLQEENEQQSRAIEHLTTQTTDSQQRAKLAEQQYVGLKDAIRTLQEENDSLKKENRDIETRLVSEKERLSAEMNKLTDMVERLKRQGEMAQTYQQHEEKRKSSKSSWFGLSTSSSKSDPIAVLPSATPTSRATANSPASSPQRISSNKPKVEKEEERKRPPPVPAKVPTKPKYQIQAHYKEASCVRYDDLGSDTLVTGGSVDGTVKVWNTANGTVKSTFKGGSHNAIIAVDLTNHLVAGGGSDKTIRVWNHKTNRMVHHLVGHANKITSLRFFGGERGIVTAAADRQIKVWDISRQTYRQTATMHLTCTANSIDTTFDAHTLGSGHTDGGLQFWHMQTGQRSTDLKRKFKKSIDMAPCWRRIIEI